MIALRALVLFFLLPFAQGRADETIRQGAPNSDVGYEKALERPKGEEAIFRGELGEETPGGSRTPMKPMDS
jgi:hypothetical protein